MLIFFINSNNRQLQLVLNGKTLQKYPINAVVSQGYILSPTLFLLYINDLPDDCICNIPIYADDTSLYSKCGQAADLWHQLEFASELESDLRDTVDCGRKWLFAFNPRKTQVVLFDRSNNSGSIDVKMDGSILEENSSLGCLVLSFSFKLDLGSYIALLMKLPP